MKLGMSVTNTSCQVRDSHSVSAADSSCLGCDDVFLGLSRVMGEKMYLSLLIK